MRSSSATGAGVRSPSVSTASRWIVSSFCSQTMRTSAASAAGSSTSPSVSTASCCARWLECPVAVLDQQRKDPRILDLAERLDGFAQRLVIDTGRDEPFDRGQRQVRRLIRKRFGRFAAHGRIGRVGGQLGQGRDRLRRLHFADGLGGLGAYLRGRVGARDAQQDLDRARIVVMVEALGGLASNRHRVGRHRAGPSGTAAPDRWSDGATPARSAETLIFSCRPGRRARARGRSSRASAARAEPEHRRPSEVESQPRAAIAGAIDRVGARGAVVQEHGDVAVAARLRAGSSSKIRQSGGPDERHVARSSLTNEPSRVSLIMRSLACVGVWKL